MQPDKHHKLGEEIVKHIIRPAFQRAGPCSLDNRGEDRPLRLGAFFLGNWIADYSQVIDPAGFAYIPKILRDAKNHYEHNPGRKLLDVPDMSVTDVLELEKIEEFFKVLAIDAYWAFGQFVAYSDLAAYADALVDGGNQSVLACCIREVHRFMAFVTHVPRDSPGKGMDLSTFGPVFDKFFVQYYAHEHFDRTDISPVGAQAPRNRHRGPANPHAIRAYMRDYIQMMAATLGVLDRWSEASLELHPEVFPDAEGDDNPVGDEHVEWNIALAHLGQILHLVEDYFAHSTFVEHAIADLSFFQKLFERHFNSDIVDLRRKLPGTADNDAASINPDVVTGYFDLRDTAASLMAAMTTSEDKSIGQHIKDTRMARASALMLDIFHLLAYESAEGTLRQVIGRPNEEKNALAKEYYFIPLRTDPATPQSESAQPINNVEAVLRYVADNAERLLELYDLQLGDPDVQKEAVRLLSAATTPIGNFSVFIGNRKSIVSVLFLLKKLLTNPLLTMLELHGELFSAAIKDALQWADDQVDQIERRIVKGLLDTDRPEHHSLLAKDSAEAPLHEPAMSLASALDWYVCKVLFRHHQDETVHVARYEPDSTKTNKIEQSPWIDWLELLETFIAHPLAALDGEGDEDAEPENRWWYEPLKGHFNPKKVKSEHTEFRHVPIKIQASDLQQLIDDGAKLRTYWIEQQGGCP